MNNKKGFIKILLVIIAIIVIALFIYIRMGYRTDVIPSSITDNKTNSSLQSSEKDFTADWKNFRNYKYGFEFKYPSQWQIVEESRTDKSLAMILSEDGINRFDLVVYDPITDANGRKVTLDEYLLFYNYNNNDLRTNKSVGDIQMLYFENKFNKERNNKSFRYIVPVRKDLMYEFILNSTDNNDAISFDKILYTFRFTK